MSLRRRRRHQERRHGGWDQHPEVRFHPARIDAARADIKTLADEIVPDEFRASGGGGMSFLRLCVDRTGAQWGEHKNMQELVCLCIAAGLASYPMSREYWNILPGGMPYVMFDL